MQEPFKDFDRVQQLVNIGRNKQKLFIPPLKHGFPDVIDSLLTRKCQCLPHQLVLRPLSADVCCFTSSAQSSIPRNALLRLHEGGGRSQFSRRALFDERLCVYSGILRRKRCSFTPLHRMIVLPCQPGLGPALYRRPQDKGPEPIPGGFFFSRTVMIFRRSPQLHSRRSLFLEGCTRDV